MHMLKLMDFYRAIYISLTIFFILFTLTKLYIICRIDFLCVHFKMFSIEW